MAKSKLTKNVQAGGLEEERMKTADAIPWGLFKLKTEKIAVPVALALFVGMLVRLGIGFKFEGKWILGLPADIFELWSWCIAWFILTIVTSIFWVREVRERMIRNEKEGRR